MKLISVWNEKMRFLATTGNHTIPMDTSLPIGQDTAATPKQLVIAAICGCTGMDVVALVKKYNLPLARFEIEAEAVLTEGTHPIVFKQANLLFKLEGFLDKEKVLEIINLSQTKYCSVSAMMSKAFPIHYTVQLNSEIIGEGRANFL